MGRWQYAAFFAAAILVLVAGGAWLSTLSRGGASVSIADESTMVPAGPTTFTAGDPSLIRPSADAYLRFAEEDAAWRARHAPPVTRRHFAEAGGEWRASPRQFVRDSVFVLLSSERITDAIAVLEQWLEANPRDAELLLELARLLNRVGRTEDSLARYRQVLALEQRGQP